MRDGRDIKRARLQSGLLQSELAEKLEVAQATVSNWEIGKSEPNFAQLKKLNRILGLYRDENEDDQEELLLNGRPSAIGVWLNRTRIQKGLSVPEIAGKAGLSTPCIYNIESGKISNPHRETIQRLEKILNAKLPTDAKEEVKDESTIKGVGELIDFDPHDDSELPCEAGLYVLYDISERPIYVGHSSNIKRRINEHSEKFWFKSPIVETGAYVMIQDRELRDKFESILIRFLKSNAVLNKQKTDRS